MNNVIVWPTLLQEIHVLLLRYATSESVMGLLSIVAIIHNSN